MDQFEGHHLVPVTVHDCAGGTVASNQIGIQLVVGLAINISKYVVGVWSTTNLVLLEVENVVFYLWDTSFPLPLLARKPLGFCGGILLPPTNFRWGLECQDPLFIEISGYLVFLLCSLQVPPSLLTRKP